MILTKKKYIELVYAICLYQQGNFKNEKKHLRLFYLMYEKSTKDMQAYF